MSTRAAPLFLGPSEGAPRQAVAVPALLLVVVQVPECVEVSLVEVLVTPVVAELLALVVVQTVQVVVQVAVQTVVQEVFQSEVVGSLAPLGPCPSYYS